MSLPADVKVEIGKSNTVPIEKGTETIGLPSSRSDRSFKQHRPHREGD